MFEITQYLPTLKKLQSQQSEYNGRFYIDYNGEIKMTYQKGQIMETCFLGCLANWHTHPNDYINLYPDHPSIIDFKYIYNMTCRSRLVGSHLIFTPKYIYVIKYRCGDVLKNTLAEIENIGESIQNLDRSSYVFREYYFKKMRQIGFDIKIYNWHDKIYIEDVHVNTMIYTFIKYVILIIFFVSIVNIFFSNK